jgi:hypothetical protein
MSSWIKFNSFIIQKINFNKDGNLVSCSHQEAIQIWNTQNAIKPVLKRSTSMIPKQLETTIKTSIIKNSTNSQKVKLSLTKLKPKTFPTKTNSLKNKDKVLNLTVKPTMSRKNSVSSIASSEASSASSSSSSKLSAVQKFRNMVLESRD